MKVFISHSHADEGTARELAQALKRHGMDVWHDGSFGSVEELSEMERGVDESQAVIFLLSPEAVGSAWVERQVRAALRSDWDGTKVKIPVSISEVPVPPFLRERVVASMNDFESYDALANYVMDLIKHPKKIWKPGAAERFRAERSKRLEALGRYIEALRESENADRKRPAPR
jgi:hypothetical protein